MALSSHFTRPQNFEVTFPLAQHIPLDHANLLGISSSMSRAKLLLLLLVSSFSILESKLVPTTLDGPFAPVTRRFDPSLRLGSDDVPMDDPRLAKRVTSIHPEQIALAASFSPSSMWISWITGIIVSFFPELPAKCLIF